MSDVKIPAILVWEFGDAPEELQIPFNGGDEDFVVLAHKGQEIPWKLRELGCCGKDEYLVDEGGPVFRRKWNDNEDCYDIEFCKWECPSYPGCTIIISSHA